ncbi:MAG: TRAP transporter permease [Deltaproteobacteria bacterium]|nr:TRAP transporter permease [Deltaproteobacteria bacterium]
MAGFSGVRLDRRALIFGLGVLLGAFHLYTGFFGLFSAVTQRAVHWGILGCMVLLLRPLRPGAASFKADARDMIDAALMLALAGSSLFLVIFFHEIAFNFGPPSTAELIWGGALLVVTLEAARRCSGLALPVTALCFLLYALLGPYLPGALQHKGYSPARIINYMYISSSGIYGIPLGVSSTFVILFILFGAFLNASGAGKFFMDLSMAFTGRFTGGAAKTVVTASAMMGTISGSPIANAVTTGPITIPIMLRNGYSRDTACAIEAVASTGGMIMPPVMGAAAFIMAEYLHISYLEVAKAAFLPAVLYFTSIYFMVDLYARRHGIKAPDEACAVRPGLVLRSHGHLSLPLIGLIFFMFQGWSPMKSVFWAIMLLIALSWLRRETRITPAVFLKALVEGARSAVPVASACATAGIILGVVSLTGVGSTVSGAILPMFSGNMPAMLLSGMLISLIMGMGLPATAVYIILATLVAPSIINMGGAPLAVHMFIFYYGIISTITPPVALTAYAAAGVGGGNATRVGFIAFKLGIASYIIPFLFIYSPSLLGQGPWTEILPRIAISLLSVYALAAACIGYMRGLVKPQDRILTGVAGLALIIPHPVADMTGLLLLAALLMRKDDLKRLRRCLSRHDI